jgi:hypothetical protein
MLLYTVVQGDNLSKIAQRFGLPSWKSIYQAPENEAFRHKRPNPNLIHPGDVIFIPADQDGLALPHPALPPGPPPVARPLVVPGASEPAVIEVGEVHVRDILVWDDPPHVHTLIPPEMKKLRHHLRLRVRAPVDVRGINAMLQSHIEACVEHGINDPLAEHIIKGLVALGVDTVATKGAAIGKIATDYIQAMIKSTMSCLTSKQRLEEAFRAALSNHFEATIRDEQEWIHWKV